MSKYTTELRYICEEAAGLTESKGFNDIDEIIEAAIPKVFNFDFPIFDENYRNVLLTKICRRYYTREIGSETVGLWKLRMETRLNEIMPYYNKLYESELITFNPMYDTDLTTSHEGNKEDNGTNSGTEGTNLNITKHNADVEKIVDDGTDRETGGYTDQKSGGWTETKTKQGTETTHDENTTNNDTTITSNTENTRNESGTDWDLHSDTPQGGLNDLDQNYYMSDARKQTHEAQNTDTGTRSDVTDGTVEYSGDGSVQTNETNNDSHTDTGKLEHDVDTTLKKDNERNRTLTSDGTEGHVGSRNTSGTSKLTSTDEYVNHVVGKNSGVSYSKLLKEFRETFLNIDRDIISNLNDLFMLVW